MYKKLVEAVDFYYNEAGYMVLTETYHLERGHCCGNRCLHCPFRHEAVPELQSEKLKATKIGPPDQFPIKTALQPK